MYVLRANPARHFVPGNIGGYDTVAGTWYGYSYLTKPSFLMPEERNYAALRRWFEQFYPEPGGSGASPDDDEEAGQ